MFQLLNINLESKGGQLTSPLEYTARLLEFETFMNIENHWFTDVTHIPSPNFNDRPDENACSLIVIHCISLPPNEFGGDYIADLFCNRLNPDAHPYFEMIYQLEVSAHLLIRRDGECVQFVPFNKRAWHAGVSSFQGRENCNDFSIGIELEGCETVAYTAEQYETLNAVIKTLQKTYPNLTSITGHSDIAPERKTDPGPSFNWSKVGIVAAIRASLASRKFETQNARLATMNTMTYLAMPVSVRGGIDSS